MEALIAEVQTAIPAAFETEDYRMRRQSLERGFQEEQTRVFEEAQKHAEARGIRIIPTPTGVTFAPIRNGAVVTPEEFSKLSEEEQKRLEEQVEEVGKEFQALMQDTPMRIRRLREQLRELDREVTVFAVGTLIEELVRSYSDLEEVVEYLREMRDDLIANAELFRGTREQGENLAQLIAGIGGRAQKESDPTRRYGVNLLGSTTPKPKVRRWYSRIIPLTCTSSAGSSTRLISVPWSRIFISSGRVRCTGPTTATWCSTRARCSPSRSPGVRSSRRCDRAASAWNPWVRRTAL